MKQFNLSNIIAVVAVLLCFYAFTGEKPATSTVGEKEHCVLMLNTTDNLLYESYSDGKHTKIDLRTLKDREDPYFTRLMAQKIGELSKDGWELKEISTGSIPGYSILMVNQYIFERFK